MEARRAAVVADLVETDFTSRFPSSVVRRRVARRPSPVARRPSSVARRPFHDSPFPMTCT